MIRKIVLVKGDEQSAMQNKSSNEGLDNCLFEVNFNISLEDYISFNQLLLKNTIEYRKKKAYITSVLLIIMSVVLGFQTVFSKRANQYFLDFLIIFIFVMGIYNILFYKKIFPKVLAKNAKNIYNTTKYFEQDLVLKIFEDKILEFSKDGEFVMDFSSVTEQYEDKNFLVLSSIDNKILVIKKNNINSQIENFLKDKLKN